MGSLQAEIWTNDHQKTRPQCYWNTNLLDVCDKWISRKNGVERCKVQ